MNVFQLVLMPRKSICGKKYLVYGSHIKLGGQPPPPPPPPPPNSKMPLCSLKIAKVYWEKKVPRVEFLVKGIPWINLAQLVSSKYTIAIPQQTCKSVYLPNIFQGMVYLSHCYLIAHPDNIPCKSTLIAMIPQASPAMENKRSSLRKRKDVFFSFSFLLNNYLISPMIGISIEDVVLPEGWVCSRNVHPTIIACEEQIAM